MNQVAVAIVGGGAAGTLAAIHLTAGDPDASRGRVVVVEPAAELGLGAAYGTQSPSHLLNVRASGMSAFPDDPGHFLAWAKGEGEGEGEWMSAHGADFLPRSLYGRYLQRTLGGRAEHVRGRATDLVPGPGGSWSLTLDAGPAIETDHVVLATGNTLAPMPDAPAHPRFVADPWARGAIDGLSGARDVLLVGSGLTAVDVALSLRDIGHRGRIRMVSSHGLLPEPHVVAAMPQLPPFVHPGEPVGRSVRAAMAAARAAATGDTDWRQVVDGIRSQTVPLWRGLTEAEQRRFLRHLARRWDVRRHRMAPQVATAVEGLRSSGRLSVERGRLSSLDVLGDRIEASIWSAGRRQLAAADAVVMCVGPSADPRRDPFLATLLGSSVATRHPLGLGLAVDTDGRVLAPDGRPSLGLWAMGSLRKGAEWEATAVPELRLHARDIAATIRMTPETR